MAEKEEKPKVKRSLFRKIINAFIGTVLGIILLLIILLGFTQTFTFRDWLREEVITLANNELNGKLNIEKLDGTILTSIFLRNTSLTIDGDTLVFARNIEIKTSPLQLLVKKIYFRKILFEDLKVKLLQDSAGVWNFAHVIKPKEEDTTESSFPFVIQVADLRLKNINLTEQSYENRGSEKVYQTINWKDLKINNLFLSAQAFIDIDNSDYLLELKEFSFKPNLTRFTLRNISGNFALTKNYVSVSDFAFITDSSDVRFNVRVDSLNIFRNADLESFKNYPTTVDLDAASFNFDDLSSFLGSTEILKGNPSFELKGHGKFGHINIEKAVLDYKSTHFEFSGEVLNLNTPGKLYIKARIKDTDINYKDVNLLLPTLELPEFAKLSVSSVNVEYEGEPTNFKTKLSGNIENGSVRLDGSMNLNTTPARYNIKFETENLDLMPVIGMTTSLNCAGSLVGEGFTPMDLKSKFYLDVVSSVFNKVPIDEFSIKSTGENRKIDLSVQGYSNKSEAYISGVMDFDKDTIPTYSMYGTISKLDLASFMHDHEYKSDLNFYFSAEGKHIDPDKITGIFSFGVDSSKYKDVFIPSSNIDIVFKDDSSGRAINLVSDFLDFNIFGKFSVSKATELIAYEAKTISNVISKKIDELNPLNIVDQSGKVDTTTIAPPEVLNDEVKFNYDFKFKNLDLISSLIGNNRFVIIGSGSGRIENNAPVFSINSKFDLDNFVFIKKDLTVYLSDMLLDLNLTRDNRFNSFDKLSGTTSLTGKRFYSTVNIQNIKAKILFNESKLDYDFAADIEDNMNTKAVGTIFITPIQQQIYMSKFNFTYNGIDWQNDDDIKIFFNPYRFNIAQCAVKNGSSVLKAEGTIENNGTLDLILSASKISGGVLSKYFMGINDPNFKANGNMKTVIRGDFDAPVIYSTCSLEDLSLKNFKLGNLIGKFDYRDKKIKTDFVFLDSTANKAKPLISLNGTIPIDLSFGAVENRFPENESIDVVLKSENFNLRSFGNVLPLIKNQSGIMNADVKFTGTLNNPVYYGYLNLRDGYFTWTQNNLEYKCGTKLKFENNGILIDSMVVSNAGGTKYPGTLSGVGSVIFEGFNVKDLNMRMNGDLAVLSPQSRAVSPLFYGDLSIGTRGDWQLTKRGGKYFFSGNVILKQTDLTYTTTQDEVKKANNFNFVYVVDSSKIDKELEKFQKVLSSEKSSAQKSTIKIEAPFDIDYEISVSAENTARAVFVLSQAANQKLFVEMRGDLKYESYGTSTRAQGAFELMSGSKLDFLGKSFDATGSLRFESDVTNPYLDVTATYQNDYIDPLTKKTEEVAVKLKIEGLLTDLGKNLSSNQGNIGVYIGSRDIQNNVRDSQHDYSDAFSFILFGKFKNDLTVQDKTNLAGNSPNILGSTATSFLGSVLSSFVNSAVGDLINNIQINDTGEYTKFNLSGRIQNLRYSFGGTTEVFQNIGKANFKLEYGSTFLIRLERKDPIVQNYSLEEKINEIALKYKFEF
jgi:hypothetical protein